MSENLDLARRYIWAFENDGDAFRETTHPEIEWAPIEYNHTILHGVAAVMQMRSAWLDTWDGHHVATEEILDRGDDMVIALHMTGRGKSSGVEVDIRVYFQTKLRDGRVIYVFEHQDRAAALKAAGIKE